MTNPKVSRRDQILQTVMKMLEAQSISPITTASLAREVGVSEAALYRHFPSKAKIFESLIEFINETLFSYANQIQKEPMGALEQCQQILTYLLALVEKNPGLCRLLTGEVLAAEKDRLNDQIQQLFDKLENQIKRILRDAEIKEGLRTQSTPTVCANLLMASVEGRLRQYSRSGLKHRPTQNWQEQWLILSAQVMR